MLRASESAVAGRPEAHGNESLVAFVQLRGDVLALDRDALAAHPSERLAPYKRPTEVHVLSHFPLTQSGKILKRELLAVAPRSTEPDRSSAA